MFTPALGNNYEIVARADLGRTEWGPNRDAERFDQPTV